MAENSKIQWCHATWSPWRGCSKVSPGCQNCYAEALSHRNPAVLGEWGPNAKRVINADWSKPWAWDRKAAKLGERHRVFPSLCDPFEDRLDLDDARARLFDLIGGTTDLDWLLLTKRPERVVPLIDRVFGRLGFGAYMAREWLGGNPPRNVWLGVSVENQEYAGERLSILRDIPAAVRWVSYEPALGPVDFTPWLDFIDWIVVGGESGPGARPFEWAWAESVREQCEDAGVAFFMKQFGSNPWSEGCEGRSRMTFEDPKGGDIDEWPESIRVREFPSIQGVNA